MVISYYMVASFVTVYYLALVPGIFETYGHSIVNPKLVSTYRRYRKFASGFEESLSGFLDAMLLFSISMSVAAITRYNALLLHPDESHSLFGLQDCVYLSTFSIFPALVLQSLSHDDSRRRIRLLMWDFVIASTIAVEVLYRIKYRGWFRSFGSATSGGTTNGELSQAAWYAACQSETLRVCLQKLLSVGHAVLLVNAAAWMYRLAQVYLGHWWMPKLRAREGLWRRWRAWRLGFRLVNGALCLCMMWAFLGLFTAYRNGEARSLGRFFGR